MTTASTSADTTSAGDAFRYAAFLSYSHGDRAAATRLHRYLENYRIPRELIGRVTARGVVPARLRPIFRDREDLAAADDLSREIASALAEARALIVLCSPRAAVSRWANIEIAQFKKMRGESDVFAAIIAGEPFASDDPARAAAECFPPALRLRDTPNGPARAEPVGADLRRDGDGMHAGRIKLVAGLIGVPLDELVHRDARRRYRRTLLLVVALMIGLALTSALALFAFRARNEAVHQRAEAEGLIEFMLGDLRKKLEPVGRLGALDTLGERALQYYQRQDASALDPDSLGRRARVVRLLGEIENQHGDLASALRSFNTAAASTAELLARDPDNPQRIFDHAQNVFYIGSIAYRRGNLGEAERHFEHYRQLANRLISIDPDNPAWQAEVGYANSNLATLFLQQGRNAEAATGFARVLAISQAAAIRKRDDVAAQHDLADAAGWRSLALERLGQLDAAAAISRTALAGLENVIAHDSDNGVARADRIITNDALARIALQRGDLGAALRYSTGARADVDRLISADPTNAEWIYNAAMAQVIDAEVRIARNDTAGSANALASAHRYAVNLTGRDSSVTKWKLVRIREQLLRAEILRVTGKPEQALAVARVAQAQIGGMPGTNLEVGEARYLLGRTWAEVAAAKSDLDDEVGARAAWRSLADDKPTDSAAEEPRMMALRAKAFAALGEHAAETALVSRLSEMRWIQ